MAEALKNHYTTEFIVTLAEVVQQCHAEFDAERFVALVHDADWVNKELKARMRHVASVLHIMLPKDYAVATEILMRVAPRMDGVSDFGGFLNMLFPDFVEQYGLDQWEHWELSMDALEVFTKHSSSEFAVRPFIIEDSEWMMRKMTEWAVHENYHVRRLASEGCRPRLPWAMALPAFKADPSAILPVLELLKHDSEEYVRRSVANNLNDIAKDHPDLVVSIAKRWYGNDATTDRLVKHACRTLLKAANRDALHIFGFTDTKNVSVSALQINKPVVRVGDDMVFSCQCDVAKAGKLRIEYAIDFMKANGKLSRKIFQVKEGNYPAGALSFNKKHSFREMSTRKHYAGEHRLAIVLNGVEMKMIDFKLEM